MRNPMTPDTARAWLDVDLDAVVRNARSYALRTGVPFMAMVKANGYGLGAVAIARALTELEPWGFGVATIDEARELHVNRLLRPILVCSPLVPDLAQATAAVAARPNIVDLPALQAWLSLGDLPFHVEIDTGMGRSGFRWDDTAQLLEARNLLATVTGWEGCSRTFTRPNGMRRRPPSSGAGSRARSPPLGGGRCWCMQPTPLPGRRGWPMPPI